MFFYLYIFNVFFVLGCEEIKNVSYCWTFYTFENANGEIYFMINAMNKKLGADLKAFYKEYPEVHSFIDGRFKYWLNLETDLIALLTLINNPDK